MECERLEVEREIAMAEAKAKVYDAHLVGDAHSVKDSINNIRFSRTKSIISTGSGEGQNHHSRKDDNNLHIDKQKSTITADESTDHRSAKYVAKDSPRAIDKSTINTDSYKEGVNLPNDLCKFLKAQSAPDVDMDYFSGNPLDYQ